LKSCCVLQDHYDDERDKTVFRNKTSDLQDPRRLFFGLRPRHWNLDAFISTGHFALGISAM